MKRLLTLAVFAAIFATQANAADPGDTKNVAVTIANTNTWQQVAKADLHRRILLCQNVGSNNQGFYISPVGSGNATPSPTGIGSQDVFTLLPVGSYEANSENIPAGAIWVIGTANDVFTCLLSPSQP